MNWRSGKAGALPILVEGSTVIASELVESGLHVGPKLLPRLFAFLEQPQCLSNDLTLAVSYNLLSALS